MTANIWKILRIVMTSKKVTELVTEIMTSPVLELESCSATKECPWVTTAITVSFVKMSGIVLIVISSLTGEKETTNLFEKEGMKSRVVAREKIPWEELIVLESSQARAEASLR